METPGHGSDSSYLPSSTDDRKSTYYQKQRQTHPLVELEGVLAVLQHELRQIPGHLHYPANLVVVRHSGKNGQTQEQLHGYAPQRPDINGPVVRQAQENLIAASRGQRAMQEGLRMRGR